jgi:hypothetical protein
LLKGKTKNWDVIPAKAGIQWVKAKCIFILLDSRLTEGQFVLSLSKGGNDGEGFINSENINSWTIIG